MTHSRRPQRDAWPDTLSARAREALLAAAEPASVRSGEFLQRCGMPSRGFCGVQDGALKLSTLCEDGREAVLALLEAGHWFGEEALLGNTPCRHDVVALRDTRVLVVPPDAFERLLKDVDFTRAVAVLSVGRVQRLYADLEDMMLLPMGVQVARRLLNLARGATSNETAAAPRTTLSLSHQILATMLGVTRQTLSKELHWLAASGSILQQYGRIQILSISKLREHAMLS